MIMVASIPNDIFQFSAPSALQAGFKTGQPRAADLTSHGSDGIGVFENGRLMILLDSQASVIESDGTVKKAAMDARLPFAMVTIFRPMYGIDAELTSISALDKLISTSETIPIGGTNSLMPFKLEATFASIEFVGGQSDVQRHTHNNIKGIIFGVVVPIWMEAISGPRIHCHFLSHEAPNGATSRVGGRVLNLKTTGGGILSLAKTGRFHLGFPQGSDWETIQLS